MLIWNRFGDADNPPPTTTCIFSDGCAQYWTGWYSRSDKTIMIKTHADDGGRLMDGKTFREIRWWAHLGNFIAATRGPGDPVA